MQKPTSDFLADLSLPYVALLDTLPIVTYVANPDGQITYLSPLWDKTFGPQTRAMVFEKGYACIVHPDDVAQVRSVWDAAHAEATFYSDEFRIKNDQGNYSWIISEARPFRSGAANNLVGWFGTISNIDQRKNDEFIKRSQAEFTERLLEASYDCIKILTLDAHLVSINENGLKALAIDRFSSIADTDWLDFWNPTDRPKAKSAVANALDGKQGRFVGRYDVRNEVRFWDVAVTALRGIDGTPAELLVVSRDVTAIHMEQERRSRWHERLHARTQALSASGDTFLRSLDPIQTTENIAQLAVQSIASLCVVDLFDDQRIRRVITLHADPAKNDTISRLLRYPPDVTNNRHPVVIACSDRIPNLVPNFTADWYASVGGTQEEIDVLGLLNVMSVITVPIVGQNKILGAMTLYLDEHDITSNKYARYDEEDLFFCEQLARRAGSALSNANSYGREQRIAMEMQKASLPKILPLIDHLRFTADYRPGNTEATVGGDWYDAFEIGEGKIGLTIGDVLGNGLKAAITMPKLRYAMRAAALSGLNVSEVLQVTDRMLCLEHLHTYATASIAIYDTDSHRLEIASAGHPAPIIRHSNGTIANIEVSGLMLGIDTSSHRESVTVEMPGQSVFVMFTDGIIEHTHDLDAGYNRLKAAISLLNIHHTGNLAADLVDEVLGGEDARDDLAVMIATIGVTSKTSKVGASTLNEVVAASA